MKFRTLATAAALAVGATSLAACATTPLYGPQTGASSSGYADQQLDHKTYRITFRGRYTTSRDVVENGLMYHAAEVAQAAGYSHFLVAQKDTTQEARLGPIAGPAFFGNYGWGWGRHRFYDPLWSDVDVYWDQDQRFVATANITMISDAEAKAHPEAINAREVMANLRNKVIVPPPQG